MQVVLARNIDQDWLSKVIPLISSVISLYTKTSIYEVNLGVVPQVASNVNCRVR